MWSVRVCRNLLEIKEQIVFFEFTNRLDIYKICGVVEILYILLTLIAEQMFFMALYVVYMAC